MPRVPAPLRRQRNRFSAHPIRARIWKFLTPLNSRHMQIAWASLIFVASDRPLREARGVGRVLRPEALLRR